MSTEAYVYMRRHQDAKVKHFDVSNVFYHKFSHGTVSYTLNEENINVMLEFRIMTIFAIFHSPNHDQEMKTEVVWPCLKVFWFSKDKYRAQRMEK